jgi:hypothetical protein
MGQASKLRIRIDCESPETLRLANSESDRNNQVFYLVPSWLLSLVAHAVLLLLLGLITLPAVRDSIPQVLTVLQTGETESQELDYVHVETDQLAFNADDILQTVDHGFEKAFLPMSIGEVDGELLDITQMVAEFDTDGPEFFGSYGKGERYAFVIDRSSSMTGKKFEVAREELLKALRQLKSHQWFYVVFFDRGMLEMFGDQPVSDMLPATPKNLRRAEYWIRKVEVGRGTMPFPSIRRALEFDPDTLFLLSDGQFNEGDHTVSYLLKNEAVEGAQFDKTKSRLRLNTIGFHHQDDGTLEGLAKEFAGTFRFVAE